MKRLSIIALAIIMALAMSACGGKADPAPDEEDTSLKIDLGGSGSSDGNDGSDGNDADAPAAELEWPADLFPSDFPKYPDGKVTLVDKSEEAGTVVFIDGSNQKSFDAYKATLEGAGWTFENDFAYKGFFILMLSFKDGEVSIMLLESSIEYTGDKPGASGSSVELPSRIEGWPKDLPYALPVYPDGDIEYDAPKPDSDSPSFGIWVRNTSKASFDSYVAAMEKDGWKLSGSTGTSYSCTKDGQHVAVLLMGDTKVYITAFVKN